MKRFRTSMVFLFLSLLLSACGGGGGDGDGGGGGGNDDPTPTINSTTLDLAAQDGSPISAFNLLIQDSQTFKVITRTGTSTTEVGVANYSVSIANSDIVQIVNGTITGLSAGSTTVVFSYSTDSIDISYTVTAVVNEPPSQTPVDDRALSVTLSNGDPITNLSLLSTGSQSIKLIATTNDVSTEVESGLYQVSVANADIATVQNGSINALRAGNTSITFSYTINETDITTTIELEVSNPEIPSRAWQGISAPSYDDQNDTVAEKIIHISYVEQVAHILFQRNYTVAESEFSAFYITRLEISQEGIPRYTAPIQLETLNDFTADARYFLRVDTDYFDSFESSDSKYFLLYGKNAGNTSKLLLINLEEVTTLDTAPPYDLNSVVNIDNSQIVFGGSRFFFILSKVGELTGSEDDTFRANIQTVLYDIENNSWPIKQPFPLISASSEFPESSFPFGKNDTVYLLQEQFAEAEGGIFNRQNAADITYKTISINLSQLGAGTPGPNNSQGLRDKVQFWTFNRTNYESQAGILFFSPLYVRFNRTGDRLSLAGNTLLNTVFAGNLGLNESSIADTFLSDHTTAEETPIKYDFSNDIIDASKIDNLTTEQHFLTLGTSSANTGVVDHRAIYYRAGSESDWQLQQAYSFYSANASTLQRFDFSSEIETFHMQADTNGSLYVLTEKGVVTNLGTDQWIAPEEWRLEAGARYRYFPGLGNYWLFSSDDSLSSRYFDVKTSVVESM